MTSVLEKMAVADMASTVVASGILGFVFHLAIVGLPFEFELIMFHFVATYLGVFLAYISSLVAAGRYSFVNATAKGVLAASCFNMAVFGSMSIYRLFFHRCRSFPGPIPAKITRFFATYKSAENLLYYKELEKMHATYGDFVRTGPREISIMRKEAVPLIYGPKTECRKSSWYGQRSNDPAKVTINMTRDKQMYRLRRRAWDKGLSMKSIENYQPKIKAKVDTLIHQLQKLNGQSTDATMWSTFLSFDIMGVIGFGKEFDNLSTGKEHPAIKAIHDHLGVLTVVVTVPWLSNIVGSIPGASRSLSDLFDMCAEQVKLKEEAFDPEKPPEDIMGWLIKAVKDKDITASPTPESLEDDSRTVLIAGSDTTANVLAAVLFYLARYPGIQDKLHSIIEQVIPGGAQSWTYEKAKSISYIDDIINETLRLKPPFLLIPTRETPPHGMQVGDVYIPGNVNVHVPTILIQRDPRWWQQPEDFIPERWGDRRAEMGTDDAPFFPFNLGMHACPGTNLAFLSLRTAISCIVQNFAIGFAPGETPDTFDKHFLDTTVIKLPPLQLRFVKRS